MSAVADHGPTNVVGSATCPDWLLLLDDPAPHQVLIVGTSERPTVAWFEGSGATVTRLASVPVEPPGTLADLVIVDVRTGRLLRDPSALAQLARCCHPRGTLRLPSYPDHALRRALAQCGFLDLRSELAASGRRRPGGRHGVVAGRGPAGGAPAWLEQFAGMAGIPIEAERWRLQVPDGYPSRKAIAHLPAGPGGGAGAVVKVTRHPRFNARLENEAGQLEAATSLDPSVTEAMPAVLTSGEVAGLVAVVETAAAGRPFLDVSRLGANCPLAGATAAWLTRLGVASSRPLPGPALADRLDDLVPRFAARFDPTGATSRFLQEQVRQIAQAGTLPGVLFHGDLGTWNLLADRGDVRALDWESAEWPGPPLWDLLYFTRSFAVRSGRRRGLRRDRAIDRHFLSGSRLTDVAGGWVRSYCDAVGLDRELAAPLFHACWLHRAVKESSRLTPGAPGHYGPLCMRLVASRGSPGLRTLLPPGPGRP